MDQKSREIVERIGRNLTPRGFHMETEETKIGTIYLGWGSLPGPFGMPGPYVGLWACAGGAQQIEFADFTTEAEVREILLGTAVDTVQRLRACGVMVNERTQINA